MMKIRKFRKSNTKGVASLVRRTFKQFNSRGSSAGAVEKYINHFSTKKGGSGRLAENFLKAPIFHVAVVSEKIVGMIRGSKGRIVNLFVSSRYHGKGIGRKLVEGFENEAMKRGSKEIRIRSSLYATAFYQNMGYRKTTGIRNLHGLKVQPMKKALR